MALFYLVSVYCLFLLFKKNEPVKIAKYPEFSAIFACFFPFFPSVFVLIFMQVIFTETVIIALFAVFMFMYYKALETDKKEYYITALIIALYSTYCKEPVFGVFLVIAVSNHLFRYRDETRKEKIFYAALIVNGILFLALYYFLCLRHSTGFYNQGRVEARGISFIITIFRWIPVLILIYLLGLVRLFCIVFKKDKAHLYYDSLLFSGMAYTFAYFLLHLNANYYFMPSVILALPAFVYWIKYLYNKKTWYALIILIPFMALLGHEFGGWLNNYHVTQSSRREFIPGIENLLSEYQNGKIFIWYESDSVITDNFHYKNARNWRRYTENAFLNYTNKTLGNEFFTVVTDLSEIDFSKNILFFYPVDNDQWQPVPDNINKTLADNNFELYSDRDGILVYRKR